MRLACYVMDATAFETAQIPKEMISKKPVVSTEEERPLNGLTPSLRGLYPIAAMMNHACVPNTRHGYDERQKMTVRATVDIPAGTEITNTYTSLLWGSPARRRHLGITKHFLCSCPRCSDPQVRTQTSHRNTARVYPSAQSQFKFTGFRLPTSPCLSVCMQQSENHIADLYGNEYWRILLKSVDTSCFWSKSEDINGHFT